MECRNIGVIKMGGKKDGGEKIGVLGHRGDGGGVSFARQFRQIKKKKKTEPTNI